MPYAFSITIIIDFNGNITCLFRIQMGKLFPKNHLTGDNEVLLGHPDFSVSTTKHLFFNVLFTEDKKWRTCTVHYTEGQTTRRMEELTGGGMDVRTGGRRECNFI